MTLKENLIDWTKSAGKIALELNQGLNSLTITEKNNNSWVTNADLAVDKYLRQQIQNTYPDHKIMSEELAPDNNIDVSEDLWIIDPIDGTHNYALGMQYSAVSVAYAYNGVVQLGAVYNFFNNEFFFAEKEKGATLNEQKITPSIKDKLENSHILLGQNWNSDPIEPYLLQINRVISACMDFRRPGAGALDICMVASGRAEAFFETLNPWDIAAAKLIADEAGCITGHYGPVDDFPKLPDDLNARHFVVGVKGVYEELVAVLKQ